MSDSKEEKRKRSKSSTKLDTNEVVKDKGKEKEKSKDKERRDDKKRERSKTSSSAKHEDTQVANGDSTPKDVPSRDVEELDKKRDRSKRDRSKSEKKASDSDVTSEANAHVAHKSSRKEKSDAADSKNQGQAGTVAPKDEDLSSPRKQPPAVPPKREKGATSPRSLPEDAAAATIADLQKKLKETEALLLFEKARVKELEARLKSSEASSPAATTPDEIWAQKLRAAEEKIERLERQIATTAAAPASLTSPESEQKNGAGAAPPPPPPPPPPPSGPKKSSPQPDSSDSNASEGGPPPPPPPPPAGGPPPPPPPSGLKIAKKPAAAPVEKPKPAPTSSGGDLMAALAGFNRNNLKKNEGAEAPKDPTPKAAPAAAGPPNIAAIALQQRLKLKSASPKSPAPKEAPPPAQAPVFGLAALKKTGKLPSAGLATVEVTPKPELPPPNSDSGAKPDEPSEATSKPELPPPDSESGSKAEEPKAIVDSTHVSPNEAQSQLSISDRTVGTPAIETDPATVPPAVGSSEEIKPAENLPDSPVEAQISHSQSSSSDSEEAPNDDSVPSVSEAP